MGELKINYEVNGKGFPLILIHGLCNDINYWNKLNNIIYKHFKVIKIDLRGHGKSDMGTDKPSIELLSKDILNILDKLAIEKYNLIGYSLGGSIAINIAEKYPNKVNKLVLLSTFAKPNIKLERKFEEFTKSLNNSYYDFLDTIIPYILPEKVMNKNIAIFEEIKKLEPSEKETMNILKYLNNILNYDCEKDLNKITAKTLIIASLNDDLVSYELTEKLNKKINDSKLILLDNVKHDSFTINKNYLNKILLEFLLDK